MAAARQLLFKGPQPVLRTKRLLLRQVTAGDTSYMQEYLSDPAVSIKFIEYTAPQSDSEVQKYVSMLTNAWRERTAAVYAVVPEEVGHPIGIAGLKLKLEHDTGETVGWVAPQFQRKGYQKDAILRVMDFGFKELGLQCIYGCTYADNERALYMLTKYKGMTFEGRLRRRIKRGDQYMDISCYSVLASEHEFNKWK